MTVTDCGKSYRPEENSKINTKEFVYECRVQNGECLVLKVERKIQRSALRKQIGFSPNRVTTGRKSFQSGRVLYVFVSLV